MTAAERHQRLTQIVTVQDELAATFMRLDWLIRDLESDNQWQATTYGRDPAFEITFDTTVVPSSTALVDLGSAISTVPQDSECLSVDEAPKV